MKAFQELDVSGLHVLDGGMATELERRGCDLSGPLWSAQVLVNSSATIAAVHRDYLEAGADCLLTASYQISAESFLSVGLGPQQAADAIWASVALADSVRRDYRREQARPIWVAASLGPYGAALHNGAEYHGNYRCSYEELVQFHCRRLAVLEETPADFVAFETIPSREEASAILQALHHFPEIAASVSFTCRDGRDVAHGERLSECAQLLDGEPQVIAVGVNCTDPAYITDLIGEIKRVSAKPIMVYPNSGERWDAAHRCWTGEGPPLQFGSMARLWRQAGAQWIGGCCRTGPEHIRAVAEACNEGPWKDEPRNGPQV